MLKVFVGFYHSFHYLNNWQVVQCCPYQVSLSSFPASFPLPCIILNKFLTLFSWKWYKIRENGFELTKKRSRRYPARTITNADYADDLAILANTPNQAETLLHSLEWATAGIGLYVNAHKTEYTGFNQTGDISTLDESSLKLVDKFT